MVADYCKKAKQPMPLALAFLLPGIILHRKTREALPATTGTALLPWLQNNKEQLVAFAARVQAMKTLTQEGLMFALAQSCLKIEAGGLVSGSKPLPSTLTVVDLTEEASQCVERAGFIGRWFAAAGTPSTILAAWGVSP
jgi:hypothetical protein